MSFETTTRFLTSAVLAREQERMVSAVRQFDNFVVMLSELYLISWMQSSRIVMGRVVDSGTGAFDLWQPIS
jgi:hypothetical protein